VKLDRAARDLEEANSPTKLNWRETGWMWVPWISASAHADADAYMQPPRCSMLLPSAACPSSPAGSLHASSAGAVDARHGSELFPDRLSILAVPRRSPKPKSHAHPARGKFHRLRIYRQGGRSRSRFSFVFQNSVPLFRLPLNYFSFPTTGTSYSLVYVVENTR
jgi:hypothetical protein